MNGAGSLTAAGLRSSDTLAPPKERRTVLNQEDFMTLLSTQLKFQTRASRWRPTRWSRRWRS